MMKTLIYAAAFTLAAAASIPAAYANTRTEAGRFPHIDSSVQFPQTRWRIVRHTFRLHIPQESSALSQLSINVPTGLKVRNTINVSDQAGHKIDTNISVNGSKIILAFPEPVAPGSRLNIAMKNVKISGVSNAWLYPVSAKPVGFDTDIPVGVVRFKVYR